MDLFQKHYNTLWGDCKSREKLKTILMQNFGGESKSIMVFLKKASFHKKRREVCIKTWSTLASRSLKG